MMNHSPDKSDTEFAQQSIPDGFEPFERPGFITLIGPLYYHPENMELGLFVQAHHLNHLGLCHGGLLATFADTALATKLRAIPNINQKLVTASLQIDYLNPAQVGDWIQSRVTVHRTGQRLNSASCLIEVSDILIARASALFMIPGTPIVV